MSHLMIENYTALEPIPTKPNGEKWDHALLMSETLFLADSAHEIISGAISEGYDQIPDTEEGNEDALLVRYQLACQYATAAQLEAVNGYLQEHGTLDDVAEEFINAAFTPRADPIPLEGPSWTGPFPLVAVATNYAPYRPGVKVPRGDVRLINPYTDTTLLESFSAAGICQYRIHEGDWEKHL